MRRSADFGATVRYGRRAVQPAIVIHARQTAEDGAAGPLIGLVVAKSVGTAVERHRVARRLRHVAQSVIDELEPSEYMVIRARPGSSGVASACLHRQLRAGLQRIHRSAER